MDLNILNKKEAVKKAILSLREKKRLSNLPKNNGLYFSAGLVIVLVVVFGLFQMKFEKKEFVIDRAVIEIIEDEYITLPDFILEKELPKELLDDVDRVHIMELTTIKVVDDDEDVLPTVIYDLPVVLKRAPHVKEIEVIVEDEAVEPIPISLVSAIPIFPGCEKFNAKKNQLECMSKKIAIHVNDKFDTDTAIENGIIGKQRILVTFVIDINGKVVNVKARAPHPELEKEAIEVIELLPKMQPAKQGFKKVPVSYALPITLKIE